MVTSSYNGHVYSIVRQQTQTVSSHREVAAGVKLYVLKVLVLQACMWCLPIVRRSYILANANNKRDIELQLIVCVLVMQMEMRKYDTSYC
jgi:hypothetical protein